MYQSYTPLHLTPPLTLDTAFRAERGASALSTTLGADDESVDADAQPLILTEHPPVHTHMPRALNRGFLMPQR